MSDKHLNDHAQSDESKVSQYKKRDSAVDAQLSSGVQTLIDRLHNDGVSEGRNEGKRIIADAEHRAEWLLQQAQEESIAIKQQAEEEAGFLRDAGKEALQQAFRDALMKLKSHLQQQFAQQVQRAVDEQVQQPAMLRDMILSIAAISKPAQSTVQLLLPQSSEDQNSEAMLDGLVSEYGNQLLQEGMELQIGQHKRGLQMQLIDQKVVVDLSSEALSELLLGHLQPRLRATLEGLIG